MEESNVYIGDGFRIEEVMVYFNRLKLDMILLNLDQEETKKTIDVSKVLTKGYIVKDLETDKEDFFRVIIPEENDLFLFLPNADNIETDKKVVDCEIIKRGENVNLDLSDSQINDLIDWNLEREHSQELKEVASQLDKDREIMSDFQQELEIETYLEELKEYEQLKPNNFENIDQAISFINKYGETNGKQYLLKAIESLIEEYSERG